MLVKKLSFRSSNMIDYPAIYNSFHGTIIKIIFLSDNLYLHMTSDLIRKQPQQVIFINYLREKTTKKKTIKSDSIFTSTSRDNLYFTRFCKCRDFIPDLVYQRPYKKKRNFDWHSQKWSHSNGFN